MKPIICLCSILICLAWGVNRGNAAGTNGAVFGSDATTAATSFLKTFRPDIKYSAQKDFTVATDSTSIIVRVPINHAREARIRIEPKNGEVESFSAFKGFSLKQYPTNQVKIGEPEIAGLRNKLINELGADTNALKLAYGNRYKVYAKSKQEMITYFWQRQIRGFPFKDDYVTATFDARDGELLALKKAWGDPPASLKVKIDLPTAKRVAANYLLGKSSNAQLNISAAKIWVVTPKSGVRKLAWVLEVPKQPGVDNATEVWVSTERAQIIGRLNGVNP